ncbi:DNA-binding pseudobarrel domain-containing protein [Artemisia annua]|uniref:DNA-binding pseudobarrel domain-containing protein n=1 Tax=Artemisia annua TaxID=35608 RepID=A0A2U1LGM9_ARTAN|nr:DNA-binding pseudobarrel domain-containing protein [Artemisia annua]
MGPQSSKFNSKTSNFASTSHFQPHRLCAPSSSTPRNMNLTNLVIQEEYPPSAIQIDAREAYSFQEVKTFKDFHIVVNGLCVDHELPDNIRSDYYRLCFQEKEFLHNGIPEHHSSKFVVGMIGETVNIYLNIKNCTLTTTTKEELDRWDNILEAFELWGMKVEFLRNKIHICRAFMFDSEAAVDIRNYTEAANELKLIEDEIPRVASEIKKLKQIATTCEGNLCFSKQKAEKYKDKFQELVDAPW